MEQEDKIRINGPIGEGIFLTRMEFDFVTEYVKDFQARRAATAIGEDPDQAYAIRNREQVTAAIRYITKPVIDEAGIDAKWALRQLVENHYLARQGGNINASNTALNSIMKHQDVDAMASDKLNVNINSDKEILERLQRGRQRVAQGTLEPAQATQDEPATSVSFL